MGVPEVIIASKANDPSLSPPQRRTRKASTPHDPSLVVPDLGAMFISDGVTPIELPDKVHHYEDPVPGIDGAAAVHRRPSIGVTRPSDEEKSEFVAGWTLNERGDAGEGSGSLSPIEGKRKSVNFHEPAFPPRTHREESYTSTTSSGSGSDTLVYSPPEESPPIDGAFYTGTILELVSDPEALREYRHLERRKEAERRGSAASGTNTGSGSRSGSLSASSRDEWLLPRTSVDNGKRRTYHTSPQSRRTTLIDVSWAADMQHPDRRPSLSDDHIRSPTRIHASPSGTDAPLPVSSPSSVHIARQPLFHPDLHPVADHSTGSRYDAHDGEHGSSASLPNDALYHHTASADLGAGRLTKDNLGIEAEMGREASPSSSSGTIRPPLAGEDGKPKARTVADCRAEDGWSG
ncbi:hypothetical protein NCC49_003953 [Naganishia albida]|nr:hypothetical protein NCC49_003953 [Naganishia albida]